jgi:hypothetical protein
VDLELRHCVSEGTLSELDLAHVSKCALGRQQAFDNEVSYLVAFRQLWREEVRMKLLAKGSLLIKDVKLLYSTASFDFIAALVFLKKRK